MKLLNQQQAIALIPSIVDGETSEEVRKAFFSYLEKDDEVKRQYESSKIVKELLQSKLKREQAPDHLKERINDLLLDMQWEKESSSIVDNSANTIKSTSNKKTSSNGNKPTKFFNLKAPARYVAAAAVILFFSLITIEFLEQLSHNPGERTQSIEDIVVQHFTHDDAFNSDAALSSIVPTSANHASEYLKDELTFPLRMPLIDGADVSRVIYSDFITDFATPIIEYYQENIDERVYVFAFKIDDLESHAKLIRDKKAVEYCKTYDDYYVSNSNGKDVVSWRWGNYWYSAVSNHNGDDLAGLVKPMNSEWFNESPY